MCKVSIIVPVYNVESYLEKCLNSLVHQTLNDIEIIAVNDGSTDKSLDILMNYSCKYPEKIKVITQENQGLSGARNKGLQFATGEYIGFVDSDDWVEKEMYEEMYKKAISKDFDMVVCDLTYIYENHTKKAYSNIKKDIQTEKEIKKSMLAIYPAAWNKLYKKSLFENNVFFKEKVWFEDVEFLYRLYPYIKSIGVVHKSFVNYLQRKGAITSIFDERLYHYISNWNGIIDFYKEKKFYENYKDVLEYCYVRYLYATFVKRAISYKNKEKYQKAVKEAIKQVNLHFPNYRKNPYFYQNGLKGIYLLCFNQTLANSLFNYQNRKNG